MSDSFDRDDWEQRLALHWADFGQMDGQAFVDVLDTLAAELPEGDPIGLFERASAQDSLGNEANAEPLYRQALAGGLFGIRRRRATIQLASTLRNLGKVDESIVLLEAERLMPSDELDDAVVAFLALSLVDGGRAREAAHCPWPAGAPSAALQSLAQDLRRGADGGATCDRQRAGRLARIDRGHAAPLVEAVPGIDPSRMPGTHRVERG
ncbi:tetratricopeptide repeat protein [Ensifer sp.]|uniref:tetratricopeptide repeat protein n=1 Tax=Ensifer sp. TaxID=1872086 RepID=UPI002896BCB4|nr:tetratricopeptide repeat protein [Ensifer sp.]